MENERFEEIARAMCDAQSAHIHAESINERLRKAAIDCRKGLVGESCYESIFREYVDALAHAQHLDFLVEQI